MEMIDNSLTVKIERDLHLETGKAPPKTVHRAFHNQSKSPTRADPKPRYSGAKSAAKLAKPSPIDVRLRSEFNVSLGNKYFKNEKFDRKIADI